MVNMATIGMGCLQVTHPHQKCFLQEGCHFTNWRCLIRAHKKHNRSIWTLIIKRQSFSDITFILIYPVRLEPLGPPSWDLIKKKYIHSISALYVPLRSCQMLISSLYRNYPYKNSKEFARVLQVLHALHYKSIWAIHALWSLQTPIKSF